MRITHILPYWTQNSIPEKWTYSNLRNSSNNFSFGNVVLVGLWLGVYFKPFKTSFFRWWLLELSLNLKCCILLMLQDLKTQLQNQVSWLNTFYRGSWCCFPNEHFSHIFLSKCLLEIANNLCTQKWQITWDSFLNCAEKSLFAYL